MSNGLKNIPVTKAICEIKPTDVFDVTKEKSEISVTTERCSTTLGNVGDEKYRLEMISLDEKKIKIICDENFSSFVQENKIADVEIVVAENLINEEKIIEAVEDSALLFIVTDEISAEKISNVAANKKVDLTLVIVREKFQLHAKKYLFENAHSATVIPYSENQNEISHKIIKAIADSLNQNKIEFAEIKKFFGRQQYYGNSEYFGYQIGENEDFLRWSEDRLEFEDISLYTCRGNLYSVINIKVMSKGKSHCTGEMNEPIAYDDIDDLKTDEDIKNALKFVYPPNFSFLIIEPDRKNLQKYRQIVRVSRTANIYPRPYIISVPLDDSIKMNKVDINLTVSDRERFYDDFVKKFDRRLKFYDDEIPTLLNFKNAEANFFLFDVGGENNKLKNFLNNLNKSEKFIWVHCEFLSNDKKHNYEIEDKVRDFIRQNIKDKNYITISSGSYNNAEEKIYLSFYVKK